MMKQSLNPIMVQQIISGNYKPDQNKIIELNKMMVQLDDLKQNYSKYTKGMTSKEVDQYQKQYNYELYNLQLEILTLQLSITHVAFMDKRLGTVRDILVAKDSKNNALLETETKLLVDNLFDEYAMYYKLKIAENRTKPFLYGSLINYLNDIIEEITKQKIQIEAVPELLEIKAGYSKEIADLKTSLAAKQYLSETEFNNLKAQKEAEITESYARKLKVLKNKMNSKQLNNNKSITYDMVISKKRGIDSFYEDIENNPQKLSSIPNDLACEFQRRKKIYMLLKQQLHPFTIETIDETKNKRESLIVGSKAVDQYQNERDNIRKDIENRIYKPNLDDFLEKLMQDDVTKTFDDLLYELGYKEEQQKAGLKVS